MEIFKGIKRYIVVLIILSCMVSYFSLQVAIYISYAIDGILFHNIEQIPKYLSQIVQIDTIKGLGVISIIIIIINGIVALTQFIRERVTTKFILKINSNVKKMLYTHILRLEYESYYSYSKVEMMQRVNDDAQEYANFYKVQFNLILDIISLSLFIVSQSISISTSVTIYLVITIAVMILFAFWYDRKMSKILEKVITKKKKMLGVTINNINQFKMIRIFNQQQREITKYKKVNQDYTTEDWKFIKLLLFYDIISEHITYLSDPIICLLGGISVMQGNMTMGQLTTLLLFATKVLISLYRFGENLEVVNIFLVVKQKIKKLMKLKEEKNEKYNYNLDGDIIFHKVSVQVSKKEIINNLNFTIKKGEKVAILGENGSGKSVLAKAILGVYPITGNLYLNYHNSNQLNNSNIREYVDLISGESDLFTGTILDNIELDAKSTEEKLETVVKEAEVYEDIKRFEERYQTMVGEKGVKLSGGQKQRILIARALMRNKPIMIFDNTFSKLDHKTSNKIIQNLIKNYPETTMIFITHKLEIEEYVNRIIRLEEGTVKIQDILVDKR